MIDKIIKRIIQMAIESFPIDEKKKAEILRSIAEKNNGKWNRNDS